MSCAASTTRARWRGRAARQLGTGRAASTPASSSPHADLPQRGRFGQYNIAPPRKMATAPLADKNSLAAEPSSMSDTAGITQRSPNRTIPMASTTLPGTLGSFIRSAYVGVHTTGWPPIWRCSPTCSVEIESERGCHPTLCRVLMGHAGGSQPRCLPRRTLIRSSGSHAVTDRRQCSSQ